MEVTQLTGKGLSFGEKCATEHPKAALESYKVRAYSNLSPRSTMVAVSLTNSELEEDLG
jgi:hypothetical protein